MCLIGLNYFYLEYANCMEKYIFLKVFWSFMTDKKKRALEHDIKILKEFDLECQYGPCIGK